MSYKTVLSKRDRVFMKTKLLKARFLLEDKEIVNTNVVFQLDKIISALNDRIDACSYEDTTFEHDIANCR